MCVCVCVCAARLTRASTKRRRDYAIMYSKSNTYRFFQGTDSPVNTHKMPHNSRTTVSHSRCEYSNRQRNSSQFMVLFVRFVLLYRTYGQHLNASVLTQITSRALCRLPVTTRNSTTKDKYNKNKINMTKNTIVIPLTRLCELCLFDLCLDAGELPGTSRRTFATCGSRPDWIFLWHQCQASTTSKHT